MADSKPVVIDVNVPANVETLTQRICKAATKQAQKDFQDACQQAARLLSPFFKEMSDRALAAKLLHDCFDISIYGGDVTEYTDRGTRVPADYVGVKCNEALKEFKEKIDTIQDQIDDLYNQVG